MQLGFLIVCLCMCSPSVCRTLAHASNGWHLTVPSSVGTEVTSFHWREADWCLPSWRQC